MRKGTALFGILILVMGMGGCGQAKTELMPVTLEPYERAAYETTEVLKGDITPKLDLNLSAVSKENVKYTPPYDGIQVDEVYVQAGDLVKEGDKLISFKSSENEEKISEYQDELKMQQLLLEHYEKLAQTDKGTDYKEDIEQLKKDMEVTKMYIAELNEKMTSYTIKAEGTGVVETVSDLVNYEKVDMKDKLIYVCYNTGEYYTHCSDDYPFVIGETYMATYRDIECEIELYEMEESDHEKTLYFRAKDLGQVVLANYMDLHIQKTSIKDAVYVEKEALLQIEDKNYLFTLNEEGFKQAHEVEIGNWIDGYVVIKSGINPGDRVVIVE